MSMNMVNKNAPFVLFFVAVLFIIGAQRLMMNKMGGLRFYDEGDDDDHLTIQNSTLLIFKTKPLVIWSSDLHIGPVHDLKNFLRPMGVRFIDKSLDHTRCHQTQTCNGMKTLKIINPHNALHLDYSLIPKFYDAYANDTEIQSVDAFACFHVPSLCELYEPFNKSLIILSTIRYELGRFGKERWTKWNQNLIRYASNPRNVVAANNLYDVNYIKYFTGIEPQWLPSYCNHPNVKYNQSRKGFLIAHNTNPGFFNYFLGRYSAACKAANCTVELTPIKQKYGHYKYSDLAAHEGIVHVPYQVSVMSFFEQYRMNIPIFAPSKELLIEWEWKRWAMRERTWEGAHGPQPKRSAIDSYPSQHSVPDPNSYKEHAVRYWVNFCDYYQFPHIVYYDSIPNLIELLQTITSEKLLQISQKMNSFNKKEEKRLRRSWQKILLNIAQHSSNHPN